MKKIKDWFDEHPLFQSITIIILILIIIFGSIYGIYALVTNSNKEKKKAEIYDIIEEKIYDSYNEEYASEYNLRNITFSVDIAKTIDLDITDVDITVYFDLDNDAEEWDKKNVCWEIEGNIPEIDFSQYGSTNTHISHYINGELFEEDTYGQSERELEKYRAKQAERDKIMSGQDWGDDYYYDLNEHKVKQKLW